MQMLMNRIELSMWCCQRQKNIFNIEFNDDVIANNNTALSRDILFDHALLLLFAFPTLSKIPPCLQLDLTIISPDGISFAKLCIYDKCLDLGGEDFSIIVILGPMLILFASVSGYLWYIQYSSTEYQYIPVEYWCLCCCAVCVSAGTSIGGTRLASTRYGYK